MKMAKVRVRGKFVFNERGGVWMKVSYDRARCIYGSDYATEVAIDPDISVFALMEEPCRISRPMRAVAPAVTPQSDAVITSVQDSVPKEVTIPKVEEVTPQKSSEGIGIRIVDCDEKLLLLIPDATAAQIAAYAQSEALRIKIDGCVKDMIVDEVAFDHTEQKLHILVSS